MIPLTVTRDEVTIPTVPAYFMVDATTGYIQLRDFGENTDHDLKAALHALAAKGMKRLLLDIRENPGGPLDQAIKVSNEFLPRGKMIVYTRGRVANSDADYRATEESEFTDIPIVLIANRDSASASEIVTGALQDHDRAYIVGETTFGKALVQSVYRISGGAGLALTTAHYYTPSRRMIQRPWDATFDEYQLYRLKDQDANRPHNPSDLRHTDAGRPVYSGGGIEPDKRIDGPIEGFSPTRFGRMLYARQEFANYAQKFVAEGDTRITQQSGARKFVKPNFVVDDAMLADFRQQLVTDKIKIDEDGFKKDLEFVKAMIRLEIDTPLFGVAEARVATSSPWIRRRRRRWGCSARRRSSPRWRARTRSRPRNSGPQRLGLQFALAPTARPCYTDDRFTARGRFPNGKAKGQRIGRLSVCLPARELIPCRRHRL